MRTCERCGGQLPAPRTGRIPRFCSTKCRVAAHRANKLPEELTSRHRWVRRAGKRPIQVDGRAASSTNPITWARYEAAARSKAGSGLGFVLGDGIGCIDLDDCIKGGELAPWAAEILAACPSTHVEVSMSGEGLHVFGLLPEGRGRVLRRGGRSVEVYSAGRYIAVTGVRWGKCSSKLADLSEVVATL